MKSFHTVFFDVDTQADFLYPSGKLYVPGSENIVENIAKLNRFAAAHAIPVISTVDAHTPDDPHFADWPPHCIVGTPGQQKPAETLLAKRAVIENHPGIPPLEGVQQVILEKQVNDCFTNVNLRPLLYEWGVQRCVVYGVVTEICVKNAVEGLLASGRQVELVTDAIRSLDETTAQAMIDHLVARGGQLTTVLAVTGKP